MNKLLYISYFAPYDTVDHAGGKVHNFYVKKLQKERDLDITLLTMCYQPEVSKLDLKEYGINYRLIVLDETRCKKISRKIISGFSYFNPWSKYSGLLLNYERIQLQKKIAEYAFHGDKPDIIILQWTQIAVMISYVKKFFPDVPIIIIEEDVVFQNYERQISFAKNTLQKSIKNFRFKNIKKRELQALEQSDLVVVNNPKDAKILTNHQINRNKIMVSSVYFDDYSKINREVVSTDILFYGAMYRDENHMSAIWFIKNVLPLLPDEYRFIVVGARPRKELLDLQNDRIKVVGFVENIEPYFEKSLCLVAPLLLGAGIKVKVLEAMSAGIPVLTNDIGIEGIEATAGKQYWHCVTKEEYCSNIKWIYENKESAKQIAGNGQNYIEEHFNMQNKYDVFYSRIIKLLHQ